MIASLRGTLVEKGADAVVVEAAGVGYALTVSPAALAALPAPGAEARLHVHTHATQDGPMQLFGFVDAGERALFELLISVQGVGPRAGIAILSGLPAAELTRAIRGGDVGRLQQIRGVGRKTAERLVVELRDKIAAPAPGQQAIGAPAAGPLAEVQGALAALGYRPAEIDAVLPALDARQPAADLLRQALAALRTR